ncbi:hypothetical protein ACFL3Q_15395 [Planctomycetota bacterium]
MNILLFVVLDLAAGILRGLIGAKCTTSIHPILLKRLFGVVLLIAAVKMILT